jgi:hypothetical protein
MVSDNAHECAQKHREWLPLLTFLELYHKDCDEFLNYIAGVTGDETWVSFVRVETEEQSRQWMQTYSQKKPEKFKQTLFTRKLMAAVLKDSKGAQMVEFIEKGRAVMSGMYWKH